MDVLVLCASYIVSSSYTNVVALSGVDCFVENMVLYESYGTIVSSSVTNAVVFPGLGLLVDYLSPYIS